MLYFKKKQRRRLWMTSALLLLISLNIAAQPKGMGKSDVDAKKVLDRVSANFKKFKTLTAKFTLKVEDAGGKIQGSKSGNISFKGNKYRVSITGQEIFFDGNTNWTYDKSGNEVQITRFDPSANSLTPQKLFTNFYDKDFLYKLNGETKIAGKTFQEVELTPIDKTKPFFKVLVNIDKSSQTISSSKVYEKNGNKYTYSVSSLKTNAPLADELFVFNPSAYPKVEIVDLR